MIDNKYNGVDLRRVERSFRKGKSRGAFREEWEEEE